MLLNYIYIRDKSVMLHFSHIIIKYHIMTLETLNCCTETFPFRIIIERKSKGVVLPDTQALISTYVRILNQTNLPNKWVLTHRCLLQV